MEFCSKLVEGPYTSISPLWSYVSLAHMLNVYVKHGGAVQPPAHLPLLMMHLYRCVVCVPRLTPAAFIGALKESLDSYGALIAMSSAVTIDSVRALPQPALPSCQPTPQPWTHAALGALAVSASK